MKVILILDEMPKSCCSCPCMHSESDICQATNGWTFGNEKEIPCPLKLIPQKKDWEISNEEEGENYYLANTFVKAWKECYEVYERSYVEGWNDCIDEILGEEE